jgi:methylenetetrahydrofolate dehydrogenase (NADP+) / methenyltetrahydrofolate cyclohydrolase
LVKEKDKKGDCYMATIIDGKKIALEIREDLKEEILLLGKKGKGSPGLAVVLVGEDPASQVYVRMKKRGCEEIGIKSFQYKLDSKTSQTDLLVLINKLNNDNDINGILVQLPLPHHIDEKIIISSISLEKDVDGFHPVNVGKIMIGDDDCFLPCTPNGCQELISRHVDNLKGKHVVIVGRSNIVGKPIANMMLQKNKRANCTVTICHTGTDDIAYYTKQADILVVAAGRPNTITGDMIKKGAVIIDVGVNRITNPDDSTKTKLVGDVDFDSALLIASAITPVPGGVGPMTIAMLLSNTLKAFKQQNKISQE